MANPLIKTRFSSVFDARPVNRAVDRAASRNLGRAGARIRKAAQWSIGSSKKISEPGSPPKSHTKRLKASILYSLARGRRSVLIGPMGGGRRYSGKTVPEILEFGARGVYMPAREIEVSEIGRNASGQFTKGEASTVKIPARSQDYEARPFMRPALNKNVPTFPSLFTNSVKG